MNKYYAVKVGHQPGIYRDWDNCKTQVHQFPSAVYKSFKTLAEAENFIYDAKVENCAKVESSVKIENIDYIIYTDGSFSQGVGGYAFLVVDCNTQPIVKKQSGQLRMPVTNQIAELYAIKMALDYCQKLDKNILIRSDSMYSINCLTVWIYGWMKNNYKTSGGQDIKNKELIVDCFTLLRQLTNVRFEHVYGHQGDYFNEMVDQLANDGRLMSP